MPHLHHCSISQTATLTYGRLRRVLLPTLLTGDQSSRPALVAEWLSHSTAMCSRAWHAQWPGFAPQPGRVRLPTNYF